MVLGTKNICKAFTCFANLRQVEKIVDKMVDN